MSTSVGTCQHPDPSQYWDVDEWRCRECGRSVSYPPRTPGPDDRREQRQDRRERQSESKRQFHPEPEPEPTLIPCSCCKEMLPLAEFHVRRNSCAKNRHYRASACRRCTAFKLRVNRQQNPEPYRKQGRERQARFEANMTPEQKEEARQHRLANPEPATAAVSRFRARKSGRNVPLWTRGRSVVLSKQPCRIAAGCPLRRFCTVEAKGLA